MDKMLDEQQFQHLKDCFQNFDKNGDGTISCNELALVLRSMGQNPTEKEIREVRDKMDPNRNGRIEFHEFVNVMSQHEIKSSQQQAVELKQAFEVFDKDGNGYITKEEFCHIMTKMGEPLSTAEAGDMINEFDRNNDGKLNYNEFIQLMTGIKQV